MKERRKARVGTISGLALLAGGTAVAAIAGGTHSAFSTVALAVLALALGHALLDEIRRQARRGGTDGWAPEDTVNTLLLGCWATVALTVAVLGVTPVRVRVIGGVLTAAYALVCGYFAWLRRRSVRTERPGRSAAAPGPLAAPTGTLTPRLPADADADAESRSRG